MEDDDPPAYCCASCCILWVILLVFSVEEDLAFYISAGVGLVIWLGTYIYYKVVEEGGSSYSSSSSSSYSSSSSSDISYDQFLNVLNEEMAKALVNNMQRFINEHSYWDEERIKKFGAFVVVTLDNLEYKQLLNLAADYNVFKAFFEELDRRY